MSKKLGLANMPKITQLNEVQFVSTNRNLELLIQLLHQRISTIFDQQDVFLHVVKTTKSISLVVNKMLLQLAENVNNFA